MDRHKNAQGAAEEQAAARRPCWEACPYGEYLNAVDDILKLLIGRSSVQLELEFIAEMQEERAFPQETAWAIAKESFFNQWNNETHSL